MKATAIGEVLTAVIDAVTEAVEYPVFDGPPSKRPDRTVEKWLSVGAETVDDDAVKEPVESAAMEAQIYGLGLVARKEELSIPCVAVGKSSTIALARGLALGIVEDVSQSLPHFPSAVSYGAQVAEVSAVHSRNTAGGAVVHVKFSVSACARLT